MKVEVGTNSEGEEDVVELEGDDCSCRKSAT